MLEFNQFNTGSVHQMFQAAAGLSERGHDVTIVSRPDATLAARAAASGVRFAGLPMRHQFDLPSILKLRGLVRELRPDVIHVHKGIAHALAFAATSFTGDHRPGAFVVNRGVSFPLDRWNRGKYRTKRVDRVVTVCEDIKRVIVTSGRLPDDKVVVVYAGTDVAQFDPAKWDARAFRQEKGIAGDRFLVAQVGVRDWKGWMELVDAVRDVSPVHPAIHLALIGCRNEGEKAEVDAWAETRGMRGCVTAVEYRSDMPNVFASCDLIVDASWAGTGITGTVREAMAMQKPVIATDCGGNRELVSSSGVGWLVPKRDVAALAGAIAAVAGDPAQAASVAANARQHVVNGFSKELRITKLEALYRTILEGKAGSG